MANSVFYIFCICFTISLKISFAYIEALAANVDVDSTSKYEPMVAFSCDRPGPAMHRIVDGWDADTKMKKCLKPSEPHRILKYCKKMYPDHDIRNIVEASYKVTIPNWPDSNGVMKPLTVRPYRCIVGQFQSEALLVPQYCQFDHAHDKELCREYQFWNETAMSRCKSRRMVVESFATLLDCEVDKWQGVEFVCCPVTNKKNIKIKPDKSSEEEDKLDEPEDDYLAYIKGDDQYLVKYKNEHEKFIAAKKVMRQRQQARITKMMKEYQSSRDHIAEIRQTDKDQAESLNTEISERFQKMYHGYEQEAEAEKRQLTALHMQKIQRAMNANKRKYMQEYMDALQESPVKRRRVEKYLLDYIKVEEKDRMHTVKHYSHLRDTDPDEAERVYSHTIEHLNLIDKRINQSLEMLSRYPTLEKKILPDIQKFVLKYRGISDVTATKLIRPVDRKIHDEIIAKYKETKEKEEKWFDDNKTKQQDETIEVEVGEAKEYDPESMEDENSNEPFHANQMDDGLELGHRSVNKGVVGKASTNAAGAFGIAIGSVAVFVIIVVAVVLLKKRSHRQHVTHGFVEVDPAASPEERHVHNMQMNGYENPTYKYFEISQNPQ